MYTAIISDNEKWVVKSRRIILQAISSMMNLFSGKAFLLFLSGVLCLTGCGGETDKSVPELPEAIAGADFTEHINISIGFWDIQSMENVVTKDGIWQYIEELFNITVTPVNLNWSDYNERYLIMGVSDSLPDIFPATTISGSSENNLLRLSDMIAGNMLTPLPEDLSGYPIVEETVNSLNSYIRHTDNKVYAFPRTAFSNQELTSSDAGMLVRKDWMENLGIESPADLQEFIDMTAAFALQDPDGNGINDTIGYNAGSRLALGKWLILGIAPQCNVYTWVIADGRYVPSYTLPAFTQVVIAYRTLYESGGLDPDFYRKKTSDSGYDFARGNLGALEYKTSPSALAEIKSYWDEFHDETEPFEEAVTYLNIFPAEDGICYSNSSSPFWSESLFSSGVDDNKMERILYLYEYLMSDEGWYLTRYGLENEDYEIVNGTYRYLPDSPEGEIYNSLRAKYPSLSLFTNLASWGARDEDFEPNEMNNVRYGAAITNMANEALQWNKENTVMVERPCDFLHIYKESSGVFSTDSLMDELTKVIIGEDDPVEMWNQVLQNWYDNGLTEYIDFLNEQVNQIGLTITE